MVSYKSPLLSLGDMYEKTLYLIITVFLIPPIKKKIWNFVLPWCNSLNFASWHEKPQVLSNPLHEKCANSLLSTALNFYRKKSQEFDCYMYICIHAYDTYMSQNSKSWVRIIVYLYADNWTAGRISSFFLFLVLIWWEHQHKMLKHQVIKLKTSVNVAKLIFCMLDKSHYCQHPAIKKSNSLPARVFD